eukprot:gene8733-1566_t
MLSQSALLLTAAGGSWATPCTFIERGPNGCTTWDLSTMPTGTFTVNDAWPEPYLVAAPCVAVDTSGCAACQGVAPASIVQLMGRGGTWGCGGGRCLRCDGDPSHLAPTAASTPNGLQLHMTGGDGGRSTVYNVVCDKSVPATNGPDPAMANEDPYTITWRHPAGCGTSASCPAVKVAQPTAAQVRWQAQEIGALIHFNMATYGACHKDPSAFDPVGLDTDQWVQSMVDLGAKAAPLPSPEAVLVAKHGCGFTLFPSNATQPDGKQYNYSVAHTAWRQGKGDVARAFLDSCNKMGIGTGWTSPCPQPSQPPPFYYSLNSNTYAGWQGWSKEQLMAVEQQQLVELWDTYGNHDHGGHSEVWFDGGFEGEIKPFVEANLAKL